MNSNEFNFTKASISTLTVPKGQRRQFRDLQIKGLIIDVRGSGSKSFYISKKIRDRSEKILLGKFPDLTVENARKKALHILGEIAMGRNPQDEIRKSRCECTFKELFDEYMERYSKKHKKSWKYDEREVKKFLSHWFNRKISDIPKSEIQKLHEKIFDENGLYQANRMLERVRSMYNKKIEWGWEGVNPASGIKKYREKARDRFILPSEMPCLIKSLSEEENRTVKDYFMLLLLTGARRTNTLMMRWEDINWEQSLWRIPDTKNGEPLNVPLVEQAIEILNTRKRMTNSEWVFPSDLDSNRHLINFKRAWKRLLQKATIYFWLLDKRYAELAGGSRIDTYTYEEVNSLYNSFICRATKNKMKLPVGLMDIRLHDIRRTFGSYQAITGASLQVIGKSLGHKSSQSTQIYARLNLDPVRASIEKATSAMLMGTVSPDS